MMRSFDVYATAAIFVAVGLLVASPLISGRLGANARQKLERPFFALVYSTCLALAAWRAFTSAIEGLWLGAAVTLAAAVASAFLLSRVIRGRRATSPAGPER